MTMPIVEVNDDPTPEEHRWVWSEFQIDPLPGTILHSYYSYEDYSGYGYVLYKDPDGVYWEVEGSHCSCNGLEGQWSPGEVTLDYLLNRCKADYDSYSDFGNIRSSLMAVVEAEIAAKEAK